MANPIQIVSLAPKPNSRLNCSSVGTGRAPVACSTITVISNAIPTSRPTPIDIQNRNTSELERGTLALSLDLVLRLGLALALGSAFALARITSRSSLGALGGVACHARLGCVAWSSTAARAIGRSSADHARSGIVRTASLLRKVLASATTWFQTGPIDSYVRLFVPSVGCYRGCLRVGLGQRLLGWSRIARLKRGGRGQARCRDQQKRHRP